jgi:hypothetical protein
MYGQYRHELNDSRGLRGSANRGVGDGDGLVPEVAVPILEHWRASLGV